MASASDFSGLDRILAKLHAATSIDRDDAIDLADEFELILVEDNRRGVLAGQDGDGDPMFRTTYRNSTAVKPRARGRNTKKFGQSVGEFKGRTSGAGLIRNSWLTIATGGAVANLPHGNLTTAEYKKLDGPPLAPRRDESRVISNYRVAEKRITTDQIEVVMAWADVLNVKGEPFLKYHFNGQGQLKRDLRGIRPWGWDRLRSAVRQWVKILLS